MRKFYGAYSEERPELPKEDWSHYRDVIRKDYDEEGHEIFVVVDKEDVYKQIQVCKDSCDLQMIIQRYLNGDESVLQRAQGQYLDCREFPESRQQALNLAFEIERAYLALPEEDRANYEDIYAFATGRAKEMQTQPEEKKEEVKDDASAT